MTEGHFARTCSLGSCGDNIFSQACTNKIINIGCPRYETIQDRENDTIGKMRKKLRKNAKQRADYQNKRYARFLLTYFALAYMNTKILSKSFRPLRKK